MSARTPSRSPCAIRALLPLLLLLPLLVAAPARAQDPAQLAPLPRPGDEVAWYIVEEGDTLEKITGRTLGARELWPENHRLNPAIRDPDKLRIGQRIRIITARPPAEREAEVTLVSRVVKTQRFPTLEEADATVGDRLRERDGIRTAESSSTELTFDERRRLFIGERSLVFLERVDSTLTGVRRESIEIRRGSAEVVAKAAPGRDRSEVEIIVGGTRARPRADADGGQTRASRPEGGGAHVMVYGGSSEVEAAGEKVAVPEGMGTAVPEDGPPAPPEKLLPAPRPLAPAARAELGYSNPRFAWSAVPGAASYVFEACADAGCAALVARRASIEASEWAAEPLPAGALFWRVTAVAPSGLDGYPSRPRPLTLTSDRPDLAPPAVVASILGAGVVERGADAAAGRALLGAGARLTLEAIDDVAGVERVDYRWNDGAWRRSAGAPLEPPAGAGPHRLEARAVDRRGRESAPWSITVERRAAPPAPPEVGWRPGDG